MIKVAFIDDQVNEEYIRSLDNKRVKIRGSFQSEEGRMVPFAPDMGLLSHGTLCSYVFCSRLTVSCEAYFIRILGGERNSADPKSLLLALDWCAENGIGLINMSLGTAQLKDMNELYGKIEEMNRKQVIMVASCSNRREMTYPAAFDSVISVISSKIEGLREGFVYQAHSLNHVDVICPVREEILEYQDCKGIIYNSNSFAAPVITAVLCGYMQEGLVTIEEIRRRLSRESAGGYEEKIHNCEILPLVGGKIEVPVIGIAHGMEGPDDRQEEAFIDKILQVFGQEEYEGICISDTVGTDWNKRTLNLHEYVDKLPLRSRLLFFCRYMNPDYIILHMDKEMLPEYIDSGDIDIMMESNETGAKDVDTRARELLKTLTGA